jgi:hypothetical protein
VCCTPVATLVEQAFTLHAVIMLPVTLQQNDFSLCTCACCSPNTCQVNLVRPAACHLPAACTQQVLQSPHIICLSQARILLCSMPFCGRQCAAAIDEQKWSAVLHSGSASYFKPSEGAPRPGCHA